MIDRGLVVNSQKWWEREADEDDARRERERRLRRETIERAVERARELVRLSEENLINASIALGRPEAMAVLQAKIELCKILAAAELAAERV